MKRRWPVAGPSKNPAHIAAELILLERGYSKDEARHGLQHWKDTLPCDRKTIGWLVQVALNQIEHLRDDMRIGTDFYRGMAYFWAYKYRFWMRGDAHGNGYKDIPIMKARRLIHKRFLDEDLDLSGETQRHDEIINEVFGTNEYKQEVPA
jgi:hypothetical protein